MNPNDNALYRTILNAIPFPVFIVDDDVRIADMNEAASAMSGQEKALLLKRSGGEVLHCLHSTDVADGCGRAPSCKQCVIRNSVKTCLQGQSISRVRMKMDFLPASGRKVMELLITASPLPTSDERLVMVMIEDITEISTLKSIIPMCMQCRKIRNDEEYWQSVEQYFHDHIGLEFSHGICPACIEKFYPEYRS
jgi:PAS domain S-box-containing protein